MHFEEHGLVKKKDKKASFLRKGNEDISSDGSDQSS